MPQKTEDTRPEWTHDVSKELIAFVGGARVVKIVHRRELVGVDSSKDWIELYDGGGNKIKTGTYSFAHDYIKFKPDYGQLMELTWLGKKAYEDLVAIDKWDAKNKRERKLYEQLKRKFGDK